MEWPPRSIMWLWGAPISAIRSPAPTSTYWNSTNDSDYGSAKSYIPEIPWNGSCASELIAETTKAISTNLWLERLLQQLSRRRLFPQYRRGQRRPERLRDRGSAPDQPCRQRDLRGISQAFMAIRSVRQPERQRAGHSGRLAVRRQRRLESLLRGLLVPTPVMAELHVRAIPASGPAVAERRSPRRSWPAFKRSSISILAAAKVIRIPRTTRWPKPNMASSGDASCNSTLGNGVGRLVHLL